MTLPRPLTHIEARVLATLMEKARTVPDTYPLTLNALLAGCNQKSSRAPVMQLAEREVLEALLDKYMNVGVYEIEKTEILQLDPFLKYGKPAKIASFFGGKAGYLKAVKELEQEIYLSEVV